MGSRRAGGRGVHQCLNRSLTLLWTVLGQMAKAPAPKARPLRFRLLGHRAILSRMVSLLSAINARKIRPAAWRHVGGRSNTTTGSARHKPTLPAFSASRRPEATLFHHSQDLDLFLDIVGGHEALQQLGVLLVLGLGVDLWRLFLHKVGGSRSSCSLQVL